MAKHGAPISFRMLAASVAALLALAVPGLAQPAGPLVPVPDEATRAAPWFARGNPFVRQPQSESPQLLDQFAGAQPMDAVPPAAPAATHFDPAVTPASNLQSYDAGPTPGVPLMAQQGLQAYPQQPAMPPPPQVPMASESASAERAPPPQQPLQPMPAASQPPVQGTQLLVDPRPGEHPLSPAVRWATQAIPQIDAQVADYTYTMVKRELVDGVLSQPEYILCKIRHRPFSAYLYFLDPVSVKGQEALYVEGRNGGNMIAHGVGLKHRLVGTVTIAPDSALAMSGNRHPITQIGFRRLTERLLATWQRDMQYGECEVRYLQGAKVNERSCTCIQVAHPVRRQPFTHYLTRLYVDDELNVPLRYEAYDWPSRPGGQMVLVEEYTYANLQLNVGLTERDFDPANPQYNF